MAQNQDFARSLTATNATPPPSGPPTKTPGEGTRGEPPTGPDAEKLPGATLLAMFMDAARAQEQWRRKAVEALQMLSNEQWDADTLAALPPNMAPIVINVLLSPLLYISGVQRQTREEAVVVATLGADPRQAEIMNALVHWVEGQTRADETDSNVFLDKIATGLGWWKYSMDYLCPDIEGNIDLERRPALAVYPDPNFFDGRWSDAQYVFDSQWFTISAASLRWPDHASRFKDAPGEWLQSISTKDGSSFSSGSPSAGDPYADDRSAWDPNSKRVRILEAWYKMTRNHKIAVDLMHPEDPIIDPEQIKEVEGNPSFVIFEKPLTTVRVAHLFLDTVLDDNLTPCEYNVSQFPLFPSVGYYFWHSPYGMVELMKDLQREKNKRRSKLIELTGRMPLSGFLNKESDGADQRELENYGAGNGVVINYKTTPPAQLQPPDLPMAVVHLEDAASREVKEVTNVHDELLGQATQKTISGAAIEARQRGGFISHELLFDTFKLERTERVKFLIGMIQEYISPTKALRILGATAQQPTAPGQSPDPLKQMMAQAQQDPFAAQDLLTVLTQSFDAEYDVVVTSKPTEPSLAMDAWRTLAELKDKGAEIPPKTLWEAAQKAGLLSEAQVGEILQFIQGQQQQAQPGAPSPGPAPPPPGPAPGPAGPPPPAA